MVTTEPRHVEFECAIKLSSISSFLSVTMALLVFRPSLVVKMLTLMGSTCRCRNHLNSTKSSSSGSMPEMRAQYCG